MRVIRQTRSNALFATLLLACATAGGCAHDAAIVSVAPDVPRELAKSTLPEYVVEPPDILLIDALYVVPLPPYHVKSMDVLAVRVAKALPEEPIAGVFQVDPDGTISLGLTYGKVTVAGLTIADAKAAIEKQLKAVLKEPQADVAIAESRGLQQIRGPHLVRPDGTVSLGTYGSVQVTGLTMTEVKLAIEKHLSAYLQAPEISVDVAAYNSKVFYVIYDGGGSGQQVYRLPITGNETVLDAVSQLNGVSPVADLRRVWVARPVDASCPDTILPVDWKAVTCRGRSETNYQLMPGDRLFVKADPLVTIDTRLSRLLAPVERAFGFTLLGTTTIQTLQGKGINGGR